MISVMTKSDIPIRAILDQTSVGNRTDAEATLRACIIRSSEVRYGFIHGELACLWGLIPPSLLSDTAYLWLLTTEIVAENKFLFIRHSQRMIEDALLLYPRLEGDVVVGNDSAFRWLRWLGAQFSPPEGKVVKFVIRRKHG
jgi:hypothetical protein